jgi:hypothetical protein
MLVMPAIRAVNVWNTACIDAVNLLGIQAGNIFT